MNRLFKSIKKFNQTNNLLFGTNRINNDYFIRNKISSSIFSKTNLLQTNYKSNINTEYRYFATVNQNIKTKSSKNKFRNSIFAVSTCVVISLGCYYIVSKLLYDEINEDQTELYIAKFKNKPNLSEFNPVYDRGGRDKRRNTEEEHLPRIYKLYDMNNPEDMAVPRVLGHLHLHLFEYGKLLPEYEYSPFQNFSSIPKFSSLPYSMFPSLNSNNFPEWINYNSFIKDSANSMFQIFNAAKENQFPKLQEASTVHGLKDLIYIRDSFHTYKRIEYDIDFYSIYKIGQVDIREVGNEIKINVEYIVEARYDINVPISKKVSFPIRNPKDGHIVSNETVYSFGIKWSSPIPASKKQSDLKWKFDGLC